jgi:hypothetical protein
MTLSMLKSLVFSIFTLLTVATFGQNNYAKAVLIPDYNNPDKYVNMLNKKLYESLKGYEGLHVFDWNETSHTFNSIEYKEIKKPIAFVKYLNIKLADFGTIPSLELKVDTSGKTIAVQYTIYPNGVLYTKTIEVKTSQIIEYNQVSPSSSTISKVINVPDFVKEFGGDPNKLKKADIKQYNKMLDKVNEKFKPIIEERYKEFVNYYASVLSSYSYSFEDNENKNSYKIIRNPENDDDKKVKYITFDGSKKDSLKKNNTLLLYQIVDFESRKTTKFIDGFYVEEVGDKQSTAKMSIWGKKKELAELLRGNNELILFGNRKTALEFNKNMNKNMTEYNVAVRKGCIFCDYRMESVLVSIPVLNTIERNANELLRFQELAKMDKFIDYNSQELLNKQLGVKYLFYRDVDALMSTDVETGKIIGSEGTFKNSSRVLIKNLFFDTFDKRIEFLKNNEITKNKVKEMVLYSDFGFGMGEDLIIYTTEEEKVGNKTIKRKVTIGEGYISESISDFIAIFKVKDGEKELFELQNQKKPFFLEYKIK